MAEKSPNLLLNNNAAPSAGINLSKIVQWFGGPLSVTATGVFDGAKLTLYACVRMPVSGQASEYADTTKFTDADWTEIASASSPGIMSLDNLNPCVLAVGVTGPTSNTRIRAIVS